MDGDVGAGARSGGAVRRTECGRQTATASRLCRLPPMAASRRAAGEERVRWRRARSASVPASPASKLLCSPAGGPTMASGITLVRGRETVMSLVPGMRCRSLQPIVFPGGIVRRATPGTLVAKRENLGRQLFTVTFDSGQKLILFAHELEPLAAEARRTSPTTIG